MLRVDSEAFRRRQLIDATIAAVADMGFAQASLGAIAQRAGVSPGLVAHYFTNKEGLLEATMRRLVRDLGARVRQKLALPGGPRDRIQAVAAQPRMLADAAVVEDRQLLARIAVAPVGDPLGILGVAETGPRVAAVAPGLDRRLTAPA